MNVLKYVDTARAKKVRPMLGQKMSVWSKRRAWPAKSYGKHERAAARSGGGCEGYVATDVALLDIYNVASASWLPTNTPYGKPTSVLLLIISEFQKTMMGFMIGFRKNHDWST